MSAFQSLRQDVTMLIGETIGRAAHAPLSVENPENTRFGELRPNDIEDTMQTTMNFFHRNITSVVYMGTKRSCMKINAIKLDPSYGVFADSAIKRPPTFAPYGTFLWLR